MDGGIHRDSLSLREVGFHGSPCFSIRRHGASGRNQLWIYRPVSRGDSDSATETRPRERDLETFLGANSFRDGLRAYLKQYSFANATWNDLIAILDARTPRDLAAWSKAWVDQPGRPQIETLLSVKGGKIERLAFQQKTAH